MTTKPEEIPLAGEFPNTDVRERASDVVEADRAPTEKETVSFECYWKYPAFHFIVPEGRKPPLNAPCRLQVPEGVKIPGRQFLYLEPFPTQVFRAFKCRIRSKINFSAFKTVWVYAPDKAVAIRYLREEMNTLLRY